MMYGVTIRDSPVCIENAPFYSLMLFCESDCTHLEAQFLCGVKIDYSFIRSNNSIDMVHGNPGITLGW